MVDLNITLPENFLEEEERCGYVIPKQMKECWAVQMDCLAEFDRVCKEHYLRYFAHAGTLLGAVRHQGFIPWDDDIDVIMLREEYEKLANLGQEAFREGYFLQSSYNDKIVRGFMRVRKDGTTCLGDSCYGHKYHRGIWLDIFVLDALPESPRRLKFWKNRVNLDFHLIAFPVMRSWHKIMAEPPLKRIPFALMKPVLDLLLWLKGGKNNAFAKYEALCRKYENTDTPYIGDIAFLASKKKIFRDKKENYRDVVMLPFENMMLPCPVGYDDILRIQYGNYMEFVKGTAYHNDLFIDANNSYEKYDELSYKEYMNLFNQPKEN